METKQWGYYSLEWCNLISSIWQLTEHGEKYLRNSRTNISREAAIWVWLVQDFWLWYPNITKLVQPYLLPIHLQSNMLQICQYTSMPQAFLETHSTWETRKSRLLLFMI